MKLSIDSVTSLRHKSGRRWCELHSVAAVVCGCRMCPPSLAPGSRSRTEEKTSCTTSPEGVEDSDANSISPFSCSWRFSYYFKEVLRSYKSVEHQNQIHTIASTTASAAAIETSKQSFEEGFVRRQLSAMSSAIFAVRFQRGASLCAGA